LEERSGGVSTATDQYVWSPVYVDALIDRDRSTANNGVLDERLYAQQDADWNVTGLINTSGSVVERYVYDPYGAVTYLQPGWGTRSSSSYAWIYLHQGGRYDTTSGLDDFRNRQYSPTQQRWVSEDPLGQGPDINWYRNESGNPTNETDPSGLEGQKRMTRVANEVEDFKPPRSLLWAPTTPSSPTHIPSLGISWKEPSFDNLIGHIVQELKPEPGESVSSWDRDRIRKAAIAGLRKSLEFKFDPKELTDDWINRVNNNPDDLVLPALLLGSAMGGLFAIGDKKLEQYAVAHVFPLATPTLPLYRGRWGGGYAEIDFDMKFSHIGSKIDWDTLNTTFGLAFSWRPAPPTSMPAVGGEVPPLPREELFQLRLQGTVGATNPKDQIFFFGGNVPLGPKPSPEMNRVPGG
jgi:RHS repeat-associated protein